MDLLQLIIRLLAFGVTLFLLLEFIVFCKVNTYFALGCLISTIIIVLALFIYLKKYDMYVCKECNNRIPKRMLK